MPLKNHQYQAIMREYDNQQLQNQRVAEQHREEVYSAIPRLEQIEQQIASLSVQQAKKLLDGESSALTELKDKLSILSSEKTDLLTQNGFAPDYMELSYRCPDCKDTGFIGNKKCHCFAQASIDLLYTQSNIREILEHENFDTFRTNYYSQSLQDSLTGITSYETMTRAVEIAKTFIRKFSYEYQNLLIYGNTGVGKTFLTNCIAKEVLESAHSVLYFSSAQLFDALASVTFSKKIDMDSSVGEDIYSCDLLIIDDLGTELTNSFVSSSLFLCLNERHLQKKTTIISTNLSLEAIRETYSERIFSRISLNYKFIKLFGDDIRILKKLQNTWRS